MNSSSREHSWSSAWVSLISCRTLGAMRAVVCAKLILNARTAPMTRASMQDDIHAEIEMIRSAAQVLPNDSSDQERHSSYYYSPCPPLYIAMGRVLLKVCSRRCRTQQHCTDAASRSSSWATVGASCVSPPRCAGGLYANTRRVGKTSLMNQYVNKRFSNQYKATIGADL